ncbi:MAG TPA: hypothetical protein VHL57_03205 [Flavobacteriales bacterium]|jgi:hypothetical protein|nr:hypothetical protein [Flavobacteriales bacterium]
MIAQQDRQERLKETALENEKENERGESPSTTTPDTEDPAPEGRPDEEAKAVERPKRKRIGHVQLVDQSDPNA